MEIINKNIHTTYEITDRFQAGILLSGPEVKSCKKSAVHFKGSYCTFNEKNFKNMPVDGNGYTLSIKNLYIAPYVPAKREQKRYNPLRQRRLLLKKKELLAICIALKKGRGLTIVPLRLYTHNRLVKIEIAIAQGLKKYDKRERIKKKEFTRRKARLMGKVR